MSRIVYASLAGLLFACSGGDDDQGAGGKGGTHATGATSGIDGGGGWATGGKGGNATGGTSSGGTNASGGAPSGGGSGGVAGGPSCGELAAQNGWASANCEWNGNNACNGEGTPTSDCDFCCEVGSSSGGSGGSGGGTSNGFGYPVGDKSTSPAGGWVVWQVLSHYWSVYSGRHLAQDISTPGGGANAIDEPVYSVADGIVRFAKPNSSAYKNVILIEHEVGDGTQVCSFYGHVHQLLVSANQTVKRGDQIASVINWANAVSGGAASNTHLHYVLVNKALCDKAAGSGAGSGICGYDKGGPTQLGRTDTASEPATYTSINDDCGSHTVQNGFLSPTKFIDAHHF